MPYVRDGKCIYKKLPSGEKGELRGCSDSESKAKAYMRALYAHEKSQAALAEFSMHIDKASRDKATGTMRLRLVNSDTGRDVFDERMSVELFQDFVKRSNENLPVPDPFDAVISKAERGWWEGGPPYLSIAHFRSGAGKNVPGEQENLYIDGEKLKSVDILYDNPLGNAVWKSVYNDLYEEKKTHENPVRVSIGFLDLAHMHEGANEDGTDFIFTRSSLDDQCEMCQKGVGDKVYLKGHLVHKAFTRVPANVRTLVEVDQMTEKSGIVSKKDDARSIIEELADDLEEKSAYEDLLVTKAGGEVDYVQAANKVEAAFSKQFSPPPQPYLYVSNVTNKNLIAVEYNPNSEDKMGIPSRKVYKIGYTENNGKFTFDKRSDWTEMEYGLMPKKSEAGEEIEWEIEMMDDIEIEEAISKRENVSDADKKRAHKEAKHFADPTNAKYKLDTEKQIRAAWNYIGMPRNQKEYSAAEVAAIKKRIIAAWKAKIDKNGPPSAQKSKSEAIMDENLDVQEEVTVEEEEPATEEEKEVTVVEESQADKAVKAITAKIAQLKSEGKYGDAALKEIQPMFNAFGEVVKTELKAPAGQVDEDSIAEKVAAKLMPTLADMIAKSIAGIAVPAQATPVDNFVSRSITPTTPTPAGEDKRSQIEKIAAASVGLQS